MGPAKRSKKEKSQFVDEEAKEVSTKGKGRGKRAQHSPPPPKLQAETKDAVVVDAGGHLIPPDTAPTTKTTSTHEDASSEHTLAKEVTGSGEYLFYLFYLCSLSD